jgi:ketopantoate reductase
MKTKTNENRRIKRRDYETMKLEERVRRIQEISEAYGIPCPEITELVTLILALASQHGT